MADPNRCSITLEDNPAEADVEFVREGLHAFNRRQTGEDDYRPLTIFLRRPGGGLVGGLLGETYWGWLHVGILWLEESDRRQGYGSRLLAAAEEESLRRGCRHAYLDTTSFQALPFYEKHGYRIWGILEDMPEGHRRIFLSKELDDGG
jgi:GNAT superfamily N-acetyltransferase